MLSTPCSTKLCSCPKISSSCRKCVHLIWHSTSSPLSPESFSSIYLRRTSRSSLHPGNASRSTMGETMRRLSRLLHKRLQIWRARMLSLLLWSVHGRLPGAPDTIPTSSKPSPNGRTRFNRSRLPSFCPQTAMRLQSPPVMNSRTPSSSSPNRSPTRPVGPRCLTARDSTGARERG